MHDCHETRVEIRRAEQQQRPSTFGFEARKQQEAGGELGVKTPPENMPMNPGTVGAGLVTIGRSDNETAL